MTEYEETIKLANRILERPNADPDDDLAMLSRQFLRQVEAAERCKKALAGMFRWQAECVNELLPHPLRADVRSILGEDVIEGILADKRPPYDPYGDLIHANRDQILKMHEEAVRRVQRCLINHRKFNVPEGFDFIGLAVQILDALNLFHPMHAESWTGWPEGSEG